MDDSNTSFNNTSVKDQRKQAEQHHKGFQQQFSAIEQSPPKFETVCSGNWKENS